MTSQAATQTAKYPEKGFATYEDLCSLPEHMVGEIADGELQAFPRPAIPHAWTSSALGGELLPPFLRGRGGPGGWWILFEPELHLGRDVLVPDLAGWRRSRVPSLPPDVFLTIAPDWVAEVLSRSTAGWDRLKKLGIYAREGVGHAWLLDPALETLEVFRRSDAGWVLVGVHGGDEAVRAEPFGEIEIALGGLWMPKARLVEGSAVQE